MYKVYDDYKNKNRMLDKTELMDIEGFLMGSRNKVFSISGSNVMKIKIVDKKLAGSVVSDKVMKKYKKLIDYLTSVLIDDCDDGTGDGYREALNQIERFRLIVKNEYRAFLTRKELEKMSKQLVVLQKELNNRLLEIHNSYIEMMSMENGRGR